MLFWRFSVASLLLFIMLPFTSRVPLRQTLAAMNGSLWKHFAVMILFTSTSAATYFLAAQRVGTGLGMVLFFCFPAIVVFLTWFIDKQRPSLVTALALVGITLGCILVAQSETNYFDVVGILLSIISAVGYAVFIYWSKKKFHPVNSSLVSALVCAGNGVILGIVAFFLGSLDWLHGTSVWLTLITMSLFATALPMLFLIKGMQYITASLAAILSVLEPLTTLIIGMLILDEPATISQLLGAAIILASAVLAQRRSKMPMEI